MARDKLSTLIQRGPVSKYADKFLKLALAAPDMGEAEKLSQFLQGFKTRICIEVELKDPNSLQEAIRMAERVDAAYYSRFDATARLGGQVFGSMSARGTTPNLANSPTPMEL